MVFQKKMGKVASNAHQSFNQSSNDTRKRIVWCKKGVRIVWVHPSYTEKSESAHSREGTLWAHGRRVRKCVGQCVF